MKYTSFWAKAQPMHAPNLEAFFRDGLRTFFSTICQKGAAWAKPPRKSIVVDDLQKWQLQRIRPIRGR